MVDVDSCKYSSDDGMLRLLNIRFRETRPYIGLSDTHELVLFTTYRPLDVVSLSLAFDSSLFYDFGRSGFA